MKDTLKYALLVIITVALMFTGGWVGYKMYPASHPCIVTSDTVYVYDTIEHTILDTVPYYVVELDTIVYRDTVFKDVDTANILKDYYALHYYTRTWEDSLLTVTLRDEISENKPMSNIFVYKILRPQVIVENVVNNYSYTRYLLAGFGMSVTEQMFPDVNVMYVSRSWYGGAEYNIRDKSFALKGGMVIGRFK